MQKYKIFSVIFLLLLIGVNICVYSESYRKSICELDVEIIDLSDNWQFIPNGSYKRNVDLPFFYVWKRDYSVGIFPDISNDHWEVVEGIQEATYKKTFNIPLSMIGRKIFIRFESVNYICQVYVNNEYVGEHLGGYVPFEFDISPFVLAPSNNNELRIEIENDYSRLLHTPDENGRKIAFWPVGYLGCFNFVGMTGSVHMIARQSVYIEDIYIQTSVREDKISAIVSIVNSDDESRNVELAARVLDEDVPVLSWKYVSVSIQSMDTVEVELEQVWRDPVFWQPGNPYFYYMDCQLKQNNYSLGGRQDRFGFKEFWIDGKYFMLNGNRCNLRGDKLVLHSERHYYEYYYPDQDSWSAILDSMLAMNISTVNFHQEPPPTWMLDACDEKGMLVNGESAVYGRFCATQNQFIHNAKIWMKEWIKRDRNHPSIALWTVSNELEKFVWFASDKIYSLGDPIQDMDPTRPYMFGGDWTVGNRADILSIYYIYGYPTGLPGCNEILNMNDYIIAQMEGNYQGSPDFNIPFSMGEFDWFSSSVPNEERVRRQGIKTRFFRILDIADIKPYRLDWMWHPNEAFFENYDNWQPTINDINFMKRSLNPIAVFDHDYYLCSIFPEPEYFDEGKTFTRKMVIFNDDFSDENVTVRWCGLVNGLEKISGEFSEVIPLGFHVEKQVTVQAPFVTEDGIFQLEWSTYKNGECQFVETYDYGVRNTGEEQLFRPAAVQNLNITLSGNNATLTWDVVTKDIQGSPTAIKSYTLIKSDDVHFTQNVDSVENINSTEYSDIVSWDENASVQAVFYKVRAIDYLDKSSTLSDDVCAVKYNLFTTDKTNVNIPGIPILIPSLNTASDLLNIVEHSNSISQWDGATQSFNQYVPDIPPTDFAMTSGMPFYVDVDQNSDFTQTGSLMDLQYSLYHHSSNTSWNDIILPFDKTDLTVASDLLQDIPNCDGVAKWIVKNGNDAQYYDQYIPGVTFTNFYLTPGMTYKVHVTQNTGWPDPDFSKTLAKESASQDRSKAPHMVWGKLIRDRNNGLSIQAWMKYESGEMLTLASPGCKIEDNVWAIQCGLFPSGWTAGDTLCVSFQSQSNLNHQVIEIPLTFSAADFAGTNRLDLPLIKQGSCALHPNFPNPFNSTTQIYYSLANTSDVNLSIYNIKGQVIQTLVQASQDAGVYSVSWHGKDETGHDIGSGLYIVQLYTNSETLHQRILLIR